MNIAFFLSPKNSVSYLYEDQTIRKALEKLKRDGYSAVPVIDREGKYISTVSEGDFLWYIVEHMKDKRSGEERQQPVCVRDVLRPDRNPPVHITATIEDMLTRSMNQNFIPVVDDLNSFIGIVTRKDIIRYFSDNAAK